MIQFTSTNVGHLGCGIACENIRFSSLFAARDVSRGNTKRPRETSPAAKSVEKRMFSQARCGTNSGNTEQIDFPLTTCI